MVVTRAQRVSHLEQVRQDCSGLQRLQRVLHDVWILRDDTEEIVGMGFREEGEVGRKEFFVGERDSAGDGAEPGMGVLEIGPRVALEGGHGIHIELVVVDSDANIS